MNRVTARLGQTRWWLPTLFSLLTFGAFVILFQLEGRFEVLTGVPVFDTQNDLTPAALMQQLPLYQGRALEAYHAFAAFDYLLPLIAGLFQVFLLAFLLRSLTWDTGRTLIRLGLPLLPLLGTLSDWLENTALLSILAAAPQPAAWLVDAAILFKRMKLIFLFSGTSLVLLLAVALVVNRGLAILRRRRVMVVL